MEEELHAHAAASTLQSTITTVDNNATATSAVAELLERISRATSATVDAPFLMHSPVKRAKFVCDIVAMKKGFHFDASKQMRTTRGVSRLLGYATCTCSTTYEISIVVHSHVSD